MRSFSYRMRFPRGLPKDPAERIAAVSNPVDGRGRITKPVKTTKQRYRLPSGMEVERVEVIHSEMREEWTQQGLAGQRRFFGWGLGGGLDPGLIEIPGRWFVGVEGFGGVLGPAPPDGVFSYKEWGTVKTVVTKPVKGYKKGQILSSFKVDKTKERTKPLGPASNLDNLAPLVGAQFAARWSPFSNPQTPY